MARRILGLDLGTSALKAVLLERSMRTDTVLRYWRRTLPREPAAEKERPYVERLREVLEEISEELGSFKTDAVIATLPGSSVSTHVLRSPFTDQKKIEQTLPFELEDQIPFGLDEVVFAHQVLEKNESGSTLLVTVTRRESLAAILKLLQEMGLDPRSFIHAGLAFESLTFEGTLAGGSESEADVQSPLDAIVDIGANSTELLFLESGRICGASTLPLAGDSITCAVALDFSTTFEAAEALKIARGSMMGTPGDEEAQRLSSAIRAGISPLTRALRQNFFAHKARTGSRVDRVWLAGGGGKLHGLPHHFSQELGCQVASINPYLEQSGLTELPESLRDDVAGGLALALAMQSPGSASSRANLRTGEFSFRGDFSFIKQSLGKIAALGVVVLCLLGFSVYANFATMAAREAQVDEAICQLTQKVLGKCYTNPDDAISRLKGGELGAAAIPLTAAGEVLVAVTERLSKLKGITLSELDVGSSKLRLAGQADTFDRVSKVVESLKDYSCFSEVSQGQTRQAKKSDLIEFNVDATIKKGCEG